MEKEQDSEWEVGFKSTRSKYLWNIHENKGVSNRRLCSVVSNTADCQVWSNWEGTIHLDSRYTLGYSLENCFDVVEGVETKLCWVKNWEKREDGKNLSSKVLLLVKDE